MHVRLVLFPDGEDPDSYAQKYGSTALQDYLAQHEDNFIMFKTRVLLDDAKNDPIRRAALVSDTAHSIALVADMLERAEYIRQCSHLLHVSEEVLTDAVAKVARQERQKAYEKEQKEEVKRVDEVVEVKEESVSAPQPATAPPEVERHLVKLLLNYGNNKLMQEFVNDDGSRHTEEYTVAEIIIGELRQDNLAMSHPLCQRVFEQCALMQEMMHEVDVSRFMNSDDEQLRVFAISLMMDSYSLSESWRAKGVFIPKIEDNLLQDLRESIFAFKSARIAQMVAERREQLRTADEDGQRMLLSEIKQYTDLARQMQQARNIVIAPYHSNY
jgi:DNA primase